MSRTVTTPALSSVTAAVTVLPEILLTLRAMYWGVIRESSIIRWASGAGSGYRPPIAAT